MKHHGLRNYNIRNHVSLGDDHDAILEEKEES